jgi:hypothetical protein
MGRKSQEWSKFDPPGNRESLISLTSNPDRLDDCFGRASGSPFAAGDRRAKATNSRRIGTLFEPLTAPRVATLSEVLQTG